MEEGKRLKLGTKYKYYDSNGNMQISLGEYYPDYIFVDSNNFLHNLNGTALLIFYFIHGERYEYKDWLKIVDLELNRIKILEQL